MDHFNYINGRLHVEGVDARDIVAAHGSPVYVYSAATLTHNYGVLEQSCSSLTPLICFSVKSCPNLSILKHLSTLGSGLDVVSGGELQRALLAGVPISKIVFAGVGKSTDEIRNAIEAGVFLLNVESEGELQRIDAIAAEIGRRVQVAVRVNPDIATPSTHEKTSTGGRQTKFGIPLAHAEVLFAPRRYASVDVVGIHIHLGSPILHLQTYLDMIDKVERMVDHLEAEGCVFDFINIGGGFPAQYSAGFDGELAIPAAEMCAALCARLLPLKQRGKRFIIEPGRSISANAGILLTTVEYIKQGWDRKIAIVDAGMNVMVRSAMYGAIHPIWPARFGDYSGHWSALPAARGATALDLEPIDIVGPICETGDLFALGRPMSPLEQNDLLAIFSCGAYGMSMASQYNSRGRPPEVLVSGKHMRLVRQRESHADLVAHELCGLK